MKNDWLLLEKDQEIQRLKAEETHHIAVAFSMGATIERQKVIMAEKDAEIERLKAENDCLVFLLQRAREACNKLNASGTISHVHTGPAKAIVNNS
jgi:hypothetical protein